MHLNRLDTLRVRAADGLASAADQAELAAAGVDASALAEEATFLRSLIAETLDPGPTPELADSVLSALLIDDGDDLSGLIAAALAAGPAPDIAGPVLDALDIEDLDMIADLGGLVAEALDGGPAPELAGDVLDALGMSYDLSGDIRAVLDGGEAPDLWADISAQLDGTTDAGDLLREALAADAGEIDIVAAVLAELGLEVAPAPTTSQPAAEVVPLFGGRAALMGTILAIAAAALLYVVPGAPVEAPIEPSADSFAYNIQDNNEVEIEELESSPDAMVQIFQTEEGAPTIIFIDEMEDAGAETSQGVPL